MVGLNWLRRVFQYSFFGSFPLSTKEPYAIMLCPFASSSLVSSVQPLLATGLNRETSDLVYMCIYAPPPPYKHIKYLVIITCSHLGTFLGFAILPRQTVIVTSYHAYLIYLFFTYILQLIFRNL